jgi:hypothetical protein
MKFRCKIKFTNPFREFVIGWLIDGEWNFTQINLYLGFFHIGFHIKHNG